MEKLMYYKILTILCTTLAVIVFVSSCNEVSRKPETVTTNNSPADINAVITVLPEAPGHEVFKQNCMSCHSARYVQMQPDLPEKTWTAIVTKMQKSFGAPMNDSAAREIVQYLVAIKGKK